MTGNCRNKMKTAANTFRRLFFLRSLAMSDLPNASSLINRVSTRMRISALARAFYKAFLWVGGIYLVA